MSEYISREAFLEKERRLYCQDCSRRKNSNGKLVYEIGDAPCRACGIGDVLDDFDDFPTAIPPHGRLIDVDALMQEFDKAQRTMQQHGQEYSCSFMSSSQEISTEWYCVEDMVENAPTIIPAEEGKT